MSTVVRGFEDCLDDSPIALAIQDYVTVVTGDPAAASQHYVETDEGEFVWVDCPGSSTCQFAEAS